MSNTAIIGSAANFTKTGDGLITQFITDTNQPNVTSLPAGNFVFDLYASTNASATTFPTLYAQVYKYSGTTLTLLATSNNATITEGTNVINYTFIAAVPLTSLLSTDRIAIQVYASNTSGSITTLYTQSNNLSSVLTTLNAGISSLNGLTCNIQNFAVGNAGTNFTICSSVNTHTFNIPCSSYTNTGLLMACDFMKFDCKGTVCSVCAVGGTGISVSGSPITCCGTLCICNTSPYTGQAVEILGSGTCSTYRCGVNNVASGNYSASLSGCFNSTTSCYSVISGGANNTVSGLGYNSISGGQFNNVSGCGAVITGGFRNTSAGIASTVNAGTCNTSQGNNSSVAGGCGNASTGGNSMIGGGQGNSAFGCNSSVVGGLNNLICTSSLYSSIAGGSFNTVIGCDAFIGGGLCNTVSSVSSSIVGGQCSIILGACSFVGSGCCNCVVSPFSIIGGGGCNYVDGCYGSVLSGSKNTACGCFSSVSAGICNQACGVSSFIAAGQGNITLGTRAAIIGGCCNFAQGLGSFIASGNCNQLCSSLCPQCAAGSTIVNGVGGNTVNGVYNNSLQTFTTPPTICNAGQRSFIGGGFQNAATCIYATVLNGCCNTASGSYSTVINGANNVASGSYSSAIGCNLIAACPYTLYTNNHCTCGSFYSSALTSGCAVCSNAGGQLVSYCASNVCSVGLCMPTAFTVTNSPLTSSGYICVAGAGSSAQYIRGDGQLATFPTVTSGSGGAVYYMNGCVSEGTIGGFAYSQLSACPIIGSTCNYTCSGTGVLARFITDTGVPDATNVPAGVWSFQSYFCSGGGGIGSNNACVCATIQCYNGSTFTTIGTSGNAILVSGICQLYTFTAAVTSAVLSTTDRIAIQYCISANAGGRSVTYYTQDNNLSSVQTTFPVGISAINSLTANSQSLVTGTSGSDFNICSLVATHTFNLPNASATTRGALTCTDWSTFNAKGTVCSVALCTTTTGLSVSGSPITNGGTICVNASYASTACTGLLQSCDWNTFNGKGSVSCVNTCTNTAGVVLSGAPVTTSGTLGFDIKTACATCNGLLASCDWVAFNAKGSINCVAITGTNIGVSGSPLTGTGGTICVSIPQSVCTTACPTFAGACLTSTLNGTIVCATCCVSTPIVCASNCIIFNNLICTTTPLSFVPANFYMGLASCVNCFNQLVTQNLCTGNLASNDIIVNNNCSTDTTYYGDFGINSSAFAGSGSFNAPNMVYLTSTTSDLALGTTTANPIHFVINSGSSDAATIKTTCQLQLPAYSSTSAFTGSAIGYLAYDASGNVLTCGLTPSSEIIVLSAGLCSAVRCGVSNVACGNYSAALSGQLNNTSATSSNSSIVGGCCNNISCCNSFIGGGFCNTVSAIGAVIAGGSYNTASANYSFIGGGGGSLINANKAICCFSFIGGGSINTNCSIYSVIGGGQTNTTFSVASSIVGGLNNTACGNYSFIGGGYCSQTCSLAAIVVGGYYNTSKGIYGFVGGGFCNNAVNATCDCLALGSVVVGGIGNNTCGGTWSIASCGFTVAPTVCNAGQYSFVGGGIQNRATGNYSVVVGGGGTSRGAVISNEASGLSSFIGGGGNNRACSPYSVLIGGQANCVNNGYSIIVGGNNNIACGGFSFIGGGNTNLTCSTALSSSIVGGNNNTTSAYFTHIGGGCCNIANGCYSSIVGGFTNTASGTYSFIGAGSFNCAICTYSTIGGGCCNKACENFATINGGFCNIIFGYFPILSCSYFSTIGGGTNNKITASGYPSGSSSQSSGTSTFATIGGGYNNSICTTSGYYAYADSNFTFIGGGESNCIIGNQVSSSFASIVGGYSNVICGQSPFSPQSSFIGGGSLNKVFSSLVFIGGGTNNVACGQGSSIVAGVANNTTQSGYYSFIGNGNANCGLNSYTVIVGGRSNTASGVYSFVGGGKSNTASGGYSFVGGGQSNCSTAGYATVAGGCLNCAIGCSSFVGGGYLNHANSCYSFIGGGACNTATGVYSSAVGCAVTNSIACSFASNQLWACNLVGTTVSLCVGTNGVIVRGASDCRLKTNICPIAYGLCDVNKLNPVSFDWCTCEQLTRGTNRQIGFIAQEVEPIIPEAVGQRADNGEYSLSSEKIIPILTKAIQELTARVEQLEAILAKNNLA
jgi:hypothetical protein